MSMYDYNEKQANREKMIEVREYKNRPEDLGSKKKRCSENQELVKRSKKEIKNINAAVDTILSSICALNDNKYAWSLGCDDKEQLLRNHINLPSNVINNLAKLSKLKTSLESQWSIIDLKILDLFRLLNFKDLVDTTLRIIEKENKSINLKRVIKTIKKIHVEHLNNFTIPKDVLKRFCKSKYVKPTRPLVYSQHKQNKDIHTEFEIKLDPSFAKSRSKSLRGLGSLDTSKKKNKKSKKKKSVDKSKTHFKL